MTYLTVRTPDRTELRLEAPRILAVWEEGGLGRAYVLGLGEIDFIGNWVDVLIAVWSANGWSRETTFDLCWADNPYLEADRERSWAELEANLTRLITAALDRGGH